MILEQLGELLSTQGDEVEAWLEARRKSCSRLFYSSVDIRHSGYKLAPVDTNLFPAGFNNLCPRGRTRAARLTAQFIKRCHGDAKRILLIPENHTRNPYYTDNLAALLSIIEEAGYETALGRLEEGTDAPVTLTGSDGLELVSSPIRRKGESIETVDGFVPDLIVVNNDFTSGAPALLQGSAIPVIPPPGMGWYRRRKSEHFAVYSRFANEFARQFGLDGWQLATLSHRCGRIDFRERGGLECVALGVEKLIRAISEKYAEHGITEEPYVFIKADSGTYGMGIMTARSGDEVYEMNKKTRHKMDTIKEGTQSTEVIIQEGVLSIDTIDGMTAEPLLYLIDGQVAGGMYRTHPERDTQSSLNTPGMRFIPMEECADQIARDTDVCAALSFVARLATLAASHEEYGS